MHLLWSFKNDGIGINPFMLLLLLSSAPKIAVPWRPRVICSSSAPDFLWQLWIVSSTRRTLILLGPLPCMKNKETTSSILSRAAGPRARVWRNHMHPNPPTHALTPNAIQKRLFSSKLGLAMPFFCTIALPCTTHTFTTKIRA